MTNDLVTIEDLVVSFPVREKRATLRAVDGVDLTLGHSETLGLIGESGSGKSTLARATLQLVTPTSGAVRFDGRDLADATRRERAHYRSRMQIVFQDPNGSFNPRHRLRRSLEEPLVRQRRGSKAQRRAAVGATLPLVGVDPDVLARYPHQISGGQKQRLSIARALLLEPEVLVCDEVVSALDVSLQAGVLNLLFDLKAELGLSLLFITHDIGVVSYISDRVAVMYLGQVVETGPTEEVMTAPRHPYTAGLIKSRPLPLPSYAQTTDTAPLHGDIPSPINPPSGCRFVTRCSFAEQRCHDEEPPPRELSPGRTVRCHLAERLDLTTPADAQPGPPAAGRGTAGRR